MYNNKEQKEENKNEINYIVKQALSNMGRWECKLIYTSTFNRTRHVT